MVTPLCNNYSLLSLLIIILCYQAQVETVKCYSCDSHENSNCGDNFDNSTISIRQCTSMTRPLDKEKGVCLKRKHYNEKEGSYNTRRGCINMGSSGLPQEIGCSIMDGTEYCTCSENLCNGEPAKVKPNALHHVSFIALSSFVAIYLLSWR